MKTKNILYFVMTKDDRTICTTTKEENAAWIAEHYPEPCEVKKVEF